MIETRESVFGNERFKTEDHYDYLWVLFQLSFFSYIFIDWLLK